MSRYTNNMMKGGNKFVKDFLTSKIVLNLIFIFTFFNLLGYLIYGNTKIILLFIISSIFIYFFNKNMIVVLGIPLFLVNFFVLVKKQREGMEGINDSDTKTEKTKQMMEILNNKVPTEKDQQIYTDMVDQKNDYMDREDSMKNTEPSSEETFEGIAKNKKTKVDYASTVEEAYSDLHNILGGDGIKNLTQDTQHLMKQQLKLAEAMKDMGPLIQGMAPLLKQAQGLLGGIGGAGGMSQLTEIAKKFAGSMGTGGA